MGSSTLTLILGSLLIIGGVVGLIFFNRSRRTKSTYTVPPVRQRTPEQELNELGILEIRPKGSVLQNVDDSTSSDAVDQDVEVIEVGEGEDVDKGAADYQLEMGEAGDTIELPAGMNEDPVSEEVEENNATSNRTEPVASPVESQEVVEDANVLSEVSQEATDAAERTAVSRREALFRMMNAIQASVDGNTACLVRKEGAGAYIIEAIVSQNPQTIKVGSSSLSASLIEDEKIEDVAVSVVEIKSDTNAFDVLGYYKAPVDIRQVAVARVKIPDNRDTYYLFIDALAWQDLDDPWQRLMISQFATLLGTYMATPQDTRIEGSDKLRLRPRREIIEEEMTRARENKEPLALALVYLNQAEEIAVEGPAAVGDAEKAFEQLLTKILGAVRIERFGELTYGVFHEEDVSEVEAWALLLQEEIENEGGFYFEKGVSIGIALLQSRHKTADDLRGDATEALRESFETGACTIIE